MYKGTEYHLIMKVLLLMFYFKIVEWVIGDKFFSIHILEFIWSLSFLVWCLFEYVTAIQSLRWFIWSKTVLSRVFSSTVFNYLLNLYQWLPSNLKISTNCMFLNRFKCLYCVFLNLLQDVPICNTNLANSYESAKFVSSLLFNSFELLFYHQAKVSRHWWK